MKLPQFSVNNKVTASMMAAILVVLGAISFSRLGLDFFPDLEFPTVSVITTYSGASSEDIENVLTRPLEQLVSSVNRVKKVTSQTSEGVSVISVEFEWGTNLDFAAQDIRDQIGLYEQFLPEEAGEPLVMKFSFSSFPVIFYGITGDMPAMSSRPSSKTRSRRASSESTASLRPASSPWTSGRSWSTSTGPPSRAVA